MNKQKMKRLKAAGWEVGGADGFLGLTKAEATLVEIKVALAASLKRRRVGRRMTQTQLAEALNSSQSRVAKMEAAESSVSIDLLVRALLVLGVSQREVAKILSLAA